MSDEAKTLTWVETTPRGVVTVTWDGTVYLIDGVIVPAEPQWGLRRFERTRLNLPGASYPVLTRPG